MVQPVKNHNFSLEPTEEANLQKKLEEFAQRKDDFETNFLIFGEFNKRQLSRYFGEQYLTEWGRNFFSHRHFLKIFFLNPETEKVEFSFY